jgi:hypothetical protein
MCLKLTHQIFAMKALITLTILLSFQLSTSIYGQEQLPIKDSKVEMKESTINTALRGKVSGLEIAKRYSPEDTIPLIVYVPKVQSDSTLWLLDDQKISSTFLSMINPDKIEKIDIEKQPIRFKDEEYNAKVSVFTKQDYSAKIITLRELGPKYLKELNSNLILYLVNGKPIIEDYDTYTVDEKFILEIEVYEKELNDGDLLIPMANIITRTKENLEKANQIYIRD